MSITGNFKRRLDKHLSGTVQINPALRQGTALQASKIPFRGFFRICPSGSFSDLCSAAENAISMLPYRGWTPAASVKSTLRFPFLLYRFSVQGCHYENRLFQVVSGSFIASNAEYLIDDYFLILSSIILLLFIKLRCKPMSAFWKDLTWLSFPNHDENNLVVSLQF